jgi:transcriptional regulator with XRE-family HTH domain
MRSNHDSEMPKFVDALVNQIREARIKADITQEELSLGLGVSQVSISNLERMQQSTITVSRVLRIGEVIGVPGWLLIRDAEKEYDLICDVAAAMSEEEMNQFKSLLESADSRRTSYSMWRTYVVARKVGEEL